MLKMPGLANPAWGMLDHNTGHVSFVQTSNNYRGISFVLNNKILIAALLLFANPIFAGDIAIKDAWARATAPGQKNGSVALLITSTKDARLVAVTSSASVSAEIHTMSMDNGVMKMRQLEYLILPAKKTVTLGPGSDHLMLFDIKHPLKEGSHVPLTLTVQFADKSTHKVNVRAQIRPLTNTGGKHPHHD